MNYHAVHHFWQRIPWYNLARAHAAIEPLLRERGAPISTGYLAVLWRALRTYGLRRPAYWQFPHPATLSAHTREGHAS